MAINYPENGFDTFTEPDMPEETPLSGQGSGSRNHVQHHKDLGDAVEVLQRNAALLSHDHSGGDGDLDTAKLLWTNTHQPLDAGSPKLADTDSSASALHHTLGTGANQAAPGNHVHDYDSGTIVNKPLIRCLSTNRPASPYLGLQIYETDTNRVRVWAQFTQNNIANTGLFSGDDFERSSATNMGADWEQVYTFNDRGVLATPDGHNLSWTDQGDDPNRCVARRIKPADATTATDDQIIIWQTGSTPIESRLPWITTAASNDMYFRMSANGTSYLRLAFTYDEWGQGSATLWGTKTGISGERRIGTLAAERTNEAWTYWTGELIGDNLSVYVGSSFIGRIVITPGVTNKGSGYRGWGIGMVAGDRIGLDGLGFGQVTPSNIASVTIRDAAYYTGTPIWQILPVGAIPSCRLRQTVAQKLAPTGTTIEWNSELEDSFNFFNRIASKTDIVMKEAGLYHIDVAIQWDPQDVPDQATVLLAINGVDTSFKQSQFIRGNLFKPGFSQTLTLAGKVRFAQNDVLTVRVKYVAPNNLIDKIFSFFEEALGNDSRVQSRIDISFLGG